MARRVVAFIVDWYGSGRAADVAPGSASRAEQCLWLLVHVIFYGAEQSH